MKEGCLYLVPTPVGNLEDMTLRGIRILKEADLILAEDTRTSGVLLKHYDITTPMRSHHKFNEHASSAGIADKISEGMNVALISDAGTPGISDPGFLLVRECRRRGLKVECLPGPTAFVPALVASGLPCDRFAFEGFLPPKKGRATRLTQLAEDPRTIIIYESPLRLPKTLKDLTQFFGANRPATVVREISKIHETFNFSTLGELADYYASNQPKGEIVIIVGGNDPKRDGD
ncbi:MAG: 16S rRNA (cytidine(1402)-2'-O)-methyltransferase [Muribaculaceae bacterium]|nr:16S rRNA (cytidine(1402)-2'-O)-methyltransferase [Muribaculaceae bacterium]